MTLYTLLDQDFEDRSDRQLGLFAVAYVEVGDANWS
jgi:hypothetical protein